MDTGETTLGKLLVDEALPEDMRQASYTLDKKGVHNLFMQLAEKHPDKYKDVLDKMSNIGRTTVWTEGMSVSLSAARTAQRKRQRVAELQANVDALLADDTLTDEQRDKAITDLLLPESEKLSSEVYDETKADGENPYVIQLESGARGKKGDIAALRGAELVTSDASGNLIPVPLWHSYGEGFTPAEYFAASYAQRRGAVSTKLLTADAGYLSKRISNAAHRILVTKDKPPQTRLPVALPVDVDDKDTAGAVLARDVGNYKAGTIITGDMLDDWKEVGIDEVLVHSSMTEPTEDGGVSQYAAGRRLQPGLTPIGENIGITSAQAVGERVSQGMLGGKHQGAASQRAERGGIEYLNRLLDGPEHFPEAGPLSNADGVVKKVEKAPQGGHYVTVNDHVHYINPGLNPVVKEGDQVEYGDELSDGVPHPGELVSKLGIGEGRRVYLKHLREALQNSGVNANRRNIEPVVSGLINWVEVTNPDGIGPHIYGDIVPANTLLASYQPREDSVEDKLDMNVGRYLDEPALNYTPGTRITKKIAKRLKKFGIEKARVHSDPPGFQPTMLRSNLSVYHDPDWRTQLAGFYVTSAFQRSLERGAVSNPASTSYIPAIAKPATLGKYLSLGKYGNAR